MTGGVPGAKNHALEPVLRTVCRVLPVLRLACRVRRIMTLGLCDEWCAGYNGWRAGCYRYGG